MGSRADPYEGLTPAADQVRRIGPGQRLDARAYGSRSVSRSPYLRGFGDWNAASHAPLVGFAPEGADDTALRTVTAYDSKGRVHRLNARVARKRPVIILGVNERTNDAGQLQRQFVSKEASSATSARGALAQVRLVKAQLHDDQEPWTKGDAETMLIAKARGLWWYDEITYLDDSKGSDNKRYFGELTQVTD